MLHHSAGCDVKGEGKNAGANITSIPLAAYTSSGDGCCEKSTKEIYDASPTKHKVRAAEPHGPQARRRPSTCVAPTPDLPAAARQPLPFPPRQVYRDLKGSSHLEPVHTECRLGTRLTTRSLTRA